MPILEPPVLEIIEISRASVFLQLLLKSCDICLGGILYLSG